MNLKERAEKAVELKATGYNCAQAVSIALADETGLTEEQLRQIAAGFGAGMGNLEATCGALVGAVMIAGMKTAGNMLTKALFRRSIWTAFRKVAGLKVLPEPE